MLKFLFNNNILPNIDILKQLCKRSILIYIGNYVKSDNYVKSKTSENIISDIK